MNIKCTSISRNPNGRVPPLAHSVHPPTTLGAPKPVPLCTVRRCLMCTVHCVQCHTIELNLSQLSINCVPNLSSFMSCLYRISNFNESK